MSRSAQAVAGKCACRVLHRIMVRMDLRLKRDVYFSDVNALVNPRPASVESANPSTLTAPAEASATGTTTSSTQNAESPPRKKNARDFTAIRKFSIRFE